MLTIKFFHITRGPKIYNRYTDENSRQMKNPKLKMAGADTLFYITISHFNFLGSVSISCPRGSLLFYICIRGSAVD